MSRAAWLKPNVKGALLLAALTFLILCFMPSPTHTISIAGDSQTQTTAWPRAAMVLCGLLGISLYPLSMWAGRRMPKEGVGVLLTGPLMIIPTGLVFALVSLLIYGDPPEIHGHLERALFLQGNTDMGGGCLFAATVGLYVTFGFTAAWYLVLKMQEVERSDSFGRNLLRAIWFLKFHILAFVVGGIADIGYDARVTPNDFRNMFLFAAVIYAFSVLMIVALHSTHLSLVPRLLLAPLFTILWLIVGSDGNTARAGQLVQSGQNPQPIVRGTRHAIMLSWHRLCDSALGDIGENTEGRTKPRTVP